MPYLQDVPSIRFSVTISKSLPVRAVIDSAVGAGLRQSVALALQLSTANVLVQSITVYVNGSAIVVTVSPSDIINGGGVRGRRQLQSRFAHRGLVVGSSDANNTTVALESLPAALLSLSSPMQIAFVILVPSSLSSASPSPNLAAVPSASAPNSSSTAQSTDDVATVLGNRVKNVMNTMPTTLLSDFIRTFIIACAVLRFIFPLL
jgi:hypothetical protein